jgi:hypothetical protein
MEADRAMQSAPQASSPWSRPSVWLLVAANLVPVYGVLALGWAVFPLVLLFWVENVIVGAFNILRMLCARPAGGAPSATKLFLIPFFTVHYGMFTFVHGIFVFVLFAGDGHDSFGGPASLAVGARDAVVGAHLTWPLLALVGSHLFSFISNYLLGGEYRRTTLQKLMQRPYGRIVVLHVAILIGGFCIHALGSPIWSLFLLIGLKLALDLRAHMRTHAAEGGTPGED